MTEVYTDGSTTDICYIIEGCKPCVRPAIEGKKVTVNEGEYYAAIAALLDLIGQGLTKDVTIFSDSELMVNQINTRIVVGYKPIYKCKAQNLKPLLVEVVRLAEFFKSLHFVWIPREENEAGKILG